MVSGNIKVEPLLLCADAASVGLVTSRLPSHRAPAPTQDTERRT
jgi:hypothetical protein